MLSVRDHLVVLKSPDDGRRVSPDAFCEGLDLGTSRDIGRRLSECRGGFGSINQFDASRSVARSLGSLLRSIRSGGASGRRRRPGGVSGFVRQREPEVIEAVKAERQRHDRAIHGSEGCSDRGSRTARRQNGKASCEHGDLVHATVGHPNR